MNMKYQDKVEKFDQLFVSLGEWIFHFFTAETLGLSLKEMMILEVTGMKKSIMMSKLAAILHLPPTTTTSIVDRMVRKGYLKRKRLEEERRIVVVSLADDGQALWEKHRNEHIEFALGLMNVLTEDEQELLINLLEKMVSSLVQKYSQE